MILSIRTDSPLRRKPAMNRLLMLATLAVFAADAVLRRTGHAALTGPLSLSARDPKLGQFFTYALVHNGWLPLLGSMLALYVFGANVNDRLRHVGYLAFYVAGAVCAGVSFVITDNGTVALDSGAAGAVMAVMGAYLALYPRSNITVFSVLFGAFEVPGMYVIFVFLFFELALRLTGAGQIAHVAPVSGMVFGFAVATGLLYFKLLPRDQWDFLALLQRWYRRRQYQVLVRQGYNPFCYVPPPPPGARPEADARLQRIADLRAEISEAIAHHNLPHAAMLFMELRSLDRLQVLSRQAQLDVANQLASQQFYAEAAQAYEQFLSHYPNYQRIEHVELMLGIICARYLEQYDRAHALLSRALTRLHGQREIALARAELARIDPFVTRPSRAPGPS